MRNCIFKEEINNFNENTNNSSNLLGEQNFDNDNLHLLDNRNGARVIKQIRDVKVFYSVELCTTPNIEVYNRFVALILKVLSPF